MTIPPLRDRREDIEPLLSVFLDRYRRRYKKPGVEISREAVRFLRLYLWPGNVRELKNAVESAVLLSEQTRPLMPQDFLLEGPGDANLPELWRQEREAIIEVLRGTGYNRSVASQELGMSRKTLYNKMKRTRSNSPIRRRPLFTHFYPNRVIARPAASCGAVRRGCAQLLVLAEEIHGFSRCERSWPGSCIPTGGGERSRCRIDSPSLILLLTATFFSWRRRCHSASAAANSCTRPHQAARAPLRDGPQGRSSLLRTRATGDSRMPRKERSAGGDRRSTAFRRGPPGEGDRGPDRAGVDGIAISANDDAGLVAVIHDAVQAGIKVITVDAPAPSSEALTYIGTDNESAGYEAGKRMAAEWAGAGRSPCFRAAWERPTSTCAPGIHPRPGGEPAPGIAVVSVVDEGGDFAQSVNKTETILSGTRQLTAIFSVSAEGAPAAAAVPSAWGGQGGSSSRGSTTSPTPSRDPRRVHRVLRRPEHVQDGLAVRRAPA